MAECADRQQRNIGQPTAFRTCVCLTRRDQIPVFSYFKNGGACRHCKSPIPAADLIPEIFLFLTLSATAAALRFSWLSFALCALVYEGTNLLFLLRSGRRERAFGKKLLFSLAANALLFSFVALLFALEHATAGN